MTACLVHGAGRPRFAAHLVQLALTAEADATWSDIRLQWEHDVVGVSRAGSLLSPNVGKRPLCATMHAVLSVYDPATMLGNRSIWSLLDTMVASFRLHGCAEVVVHGGIEEAMAMDLVHAGVASLSMPLRKRKPTFTLTEPAAATALAWVLGQLHSHRPTRHMLDQRPALDDASAAGARQADDGDVKAPHSTCGGVACVVEPAMKRRRLRYRCSESRCVWCYKVPLLRLDPLFLLTVLWYAAGKDNGEDGDHTAPVSLPAMSGSTRSATTVAGSKSEHE